MKPILIALFSLMFGFLAYSQDRVKVKIETKYGDMIAELYNETPIHRDNFIMLVEKGFYDGTLFHRVIPSFMIQGGDPTSKNNSPNIKIGTGGPGYTLPPEFNSKFFHKKGALAAARMGDAVNPKKESSGSQFYIVEGKVYDEKTIDAVVLRMGKTLTSEQKKIYTSIGGTPHLDGDYTVFGELVEGFEVISKISNVTRDKSNLPTNNIKMTLSIIK